MYNRIFFTTLFLLLFGNTIFADNDKKIVVETKNGISSYSLSDVRCMKFSNGIMSVKMHNGLAMDWSTESVCCVRLLGQFSNNITSLGQISTEHLFIQQGNSIVVRTESCKPLLLLTMDCQLIYSATCYGEEIIDLSRLDKGIYILNINGNTYKIINR